MIRKIKLLSLVILTCTGCFKPARPDATTLARRDQELKSLLTQAVIGLRKNTTEGRDQALGALTVAIELAPQDARVLDGLGSLYFQEENYQAAKSYFKRAIAADPQYSRPYAHLALIARKESNQSEAERLSRIALKKNPLNFRARNNFAVIEQELGKHNYAADEFYRAHLASKQRARLIRSNINKQKEEL
ncbi:hypothetical protein JNK13_11440 [bacterium]|nr:hypothetical protein [bacterium]